LSGTSVNCTLCTLDQSWTKAERTATLAGLALLLFLITDETNEATARASAAKHLTAVRKRRRAAAENKWRRLESARRSPE
jgi:hypothetical protein